jgi:hypothetical protein
MALWSTMYSVPATCTFYACAQTTTTQAFVHATACTCACMRVHLRVTTCEGVHTHADTHTQLACQDVRAVPFMSPRCTQKVCAIACASSLANTSTKCSCNAGASRAVVGRQAREDHRMPSHLLCELDLERPQPLCRKAPVGATGSAVSRSQPVRRGVRGRGIHSHARLPTKASVSRRRPKGSSAELVSHARLPAGDRARRNTAASSQLPH